MGDQTKIAWTDATWPVVAGCTKVSPGCQSCYAVRDSWRLGHNPNAAVRAAYEGTVEKLELFNGAPYATYEWSGVVRPLPERLDWPLRWRKPRRIFVSNMGDLFHELVPHLFIAAVFGVMAATPRHAFQVLTKRPAAAIEWFGFVDHMAELACKVFPDESLNWRRHHVLRAADIRFADRWLPSIPKDPQWPLPNVWLGVTAENHEMSDQRIPILLQVPAAGRLVSCEPLLGPVDLTRTYTGMYPEDGRRHGKTAMQLLDWVIVGGETGPRARPMQIEWVRAIRDQCQAAGLKFFFKGMGRVWELTKQPVPEDLMVREWPEFP